MQADLKYAQLLYDKAAKLDLIKKTLDEVTAMDSAISSMPEISKAVVSPVYREQVEKIFTEIAKKLKINELVYNFMQLLIKQKRLKLLPNIINEYKNIIEKHKGLMSVDLVSARVLDKNGKIAVEKLLNDKFGQNIAVKYSIDPQLIGGIKATQGSLVFDASIKGAIDKLLIS